MRDTNDEARRLRADARRLIPGEIVRAGAPKPALYAHLTLEARVEHMAALCATQWLLSGGTLSKVSRTELPGEVFECHRG